MQVESTARVRQAVAAAQAVGAQHGIPTRRARVLHDANNVVVHFVSSPVVAKICPSSEAGIPKLERELAVARHLVKAGAPVVGPTSELPAGPHIREGCGISFWRYHDHDADAAMSSRAMAETLAAVHGALAGFAAPLASFLDLRVKRTGAALANPRCATALSNCDHAFLQLEFASIMSSLRPRTLMHQTLHGDPHKGNFLAGRDGCLMIDFESVCSGPVEWDVSALPRGAEGSFAVDEQLLSVLRRLRSLCVVVWCATRAARTKELQRAAMLHLDLLKKVA